MRSLLTLALAASAAVAAADPIFRWPFLSSTDPLHIRAARDNDDFPDLHAVGEHRMIAEYAGGVSATAYRDGNNNTGVMAICTNETDKGDSIGVAIMMKGEDSWTHLKYIAVEKLPGLNLASDKPPTAVQLPSGKILVAYLQMGIMPYDFDRFSFYLSSDHGNTWEDLEPVERRRQSDGGGTVTVSLWDAYLRLSRNGTVVQLYYVEGSKEDEGTRTINMMWSDTEGRSWMPGQYDHHTVTQKKRGVLQYHPRIIEWGDDLLQVETGCSPTRVGLTTRVLIAVSFTPCLLEISKGGRSTSSSPLTTAIVGGMTRSFSRPLAIATSPSHTCSMSTGLSC
ncbi:hypothetical protein B0T14DRAFT_522678 [Immersiella caudata]|uniref:Sialidase domain-containing protein n=1 Tax=Immersiella caudata TaxID=314043 RepID=A0AA39WIS8_9PEZI|nr:hypothetical protein B0T14DRAFT_522678 [Immersiella caudata]